MEPESPHLILRLPDGDVRVFLNGQTITVGRHSDNDVVIADDSVSSHHAEVVLHGETYLIKDLDSSNGTKINGHAVIEKALSNGDRIQFGQFECYFRYPEPIRRYESLETGVVPVALPRIAPALESEMALGAKLSKFGDLALQEARRKANLSGLKGRIEKAKCVDLEDARLVLGKRAYQSKVARDKWGAQYDEIVEIERTIASKRAGVLARDGAKALQRLKSAAVSTKMKLEAKALEREMDGLLIALGADVAACKLPEDMEGMCSEVRAVESAIQEMEREYTVLSENHSSQTELRVLSASIKDDTASHLHRAGDTFMEMVSGTPTEEENVGNAPRLSKQIPLCERLVLGRDAKCEAVLPGRDVSQAHAEITREVDCYIIRDLDSTTGTFVNGNKIGTSCRLHEGDRVRIGPFSLLFEGDSLWSSSEKRNARISVHNLTRSVVCSDTGKPLKLIDDINLVINANEFVALLGPSGSGKSTLMDAINGRRPATSGRVMVNEDDFYSAYGYYRRAIGYVPQQDIVHTSLTVRQALRFSARLRLPSDTSPREIEQIIEEVIKTLGLTERRNTLIANLSGGQIKRVSLGVELISEPSLLFLDEATSGLDAGTEGKMMTLFRRIANEGATVVCITHNVENVGICDLVVVLASGRLAYYGPPGELTTYFGVSKVSDVYDRLESKPAEEWAVRFRNSEQYRVYVSERLESQHLKSRNGNSDNAQRDARSSEEKRECLRQLHVLRQRYTMVTFQDRKNVGILLAQAPIIGLLIGLVFHNSRGETPPDEMIAFLMVVSAIWFGCTNGAKEIIKELPIYLRERAINLKLPAYLGSKLIVLSALCSVQCFALLVIVKAMTGLHVGFFGPFLLLLLTSLSGVVMGLLVSSFVSNADKATAIVPILLIPQVILADQITPLRHFPLLIARLFIVSFWARDAMLYTISDDFTYSYSEQPFIVDLFCLIAFLGVFALVAFWGLRRKDIWRSHGDSRIRNSTATGTE